MLRNLPCIRIAVIAICVIAVICMWIFQPNNDTKGLPDAIWGNPIKFEDDSVMPHSAIEQVVSDGQRVYVLYTSTKGVVQVYDHTGAYLYSWRLYAHQNGAFGMAVHEDTLYIQDYHADIYVFRDGEFVEFLTNSAADTIANTIPYVEFESNTEGYKIKSGSIWRIDGETQICLINRPAQTGIYQNNINYLITILLFGAVAMIYWRKTTHKA